MSQSDSVAPFPGQLCNPALHNCFVRICLGKGPHVFEVASRKTFHLWEGFSEVFRQLIDDFAAPT